LGHPAVNDGKVVLVEAVALAPGEEALARIEPVFPEFWSAVRSGTSIPVQEGSRVVGHVSVVSVTRPELLTPAVSMFVCQARELCAFVESAGEMTLADRLEAARQRLLALYAAAIPLELGDVSTGDDVARPKPPESWKDFEEYELYLEVFDPYDLPNMPKPVVGSLSDDLLDIYLDVREGLTRWEAGDERGALWSWRFLFDAHWGDHAINALRALHRACGRVETGKA
jgi:hypothetical protein